jgi:hypothetical protein
VRPASITPSPGLERVLELQRDVGDLDRFIEAVDDPSCVAELVDIRLAGRRQEVRQFLAGEPAVLHPVDHDLGRDVRTKSQRGICQQCAV